jgi:dTDP-4-dehydrorhamnose 3,5-epimerase
MVELDIMIDGVQKNRLRVMEACGGDVLHGIKKTDRGYVNFGEAYFSIIHRGSVKAWKRHREMTLNLIVPFGEVLFVIYDDRQTSPTFGAFNEVVLSRLNYLRLTISPMLWFGFKGIGSSESLVLNVADLEHSPNEIDRKSIDDIGYQWSLKQ